MGHQFFQLVLSVILAQIALQFARVALTYFCLLAQQNHEGVA